MRNIVEALVVAVPAHNEAATLPATLRSIRRALLESRNAGALTVRLVVAADSCTDTTSADAARWGADVVEVRQRMAGAARAAAVARGLRSCGARPEATWIVTTDADCVVRPSWLTHQLDCAGRGWHCVLGTVRISPDPPVAASVRALHEAHYFADRTGPDWSHPHVHGANLGIRGDVYLRAGGFPALPHSEDRALVDALPTRARILRTDACPVLTSGRTAPRAPHGFGTYLGHLTARGCPSSSVDSPGPRTAPHGAGPGDR
ncbi:glycosyltransferase [Streptomyces brevispora]|uniref:4,4'-diaponeurosporenoate glycosyltransferase n=1 Tax=Streptomyces brevispora TaxID=887462 RepID=A0A561V691_9ACTN|nr:glycosyltransferase [Streptomyces brevispora]TWG07131.1 glycosyl transferase family 2 [Streptomyces brevispora]WSC12032.1 glycosyltransferase [Streptomyces brevispora]